MPAALAAAAVLLAMWTAGIGMAGAAPEPIPSLTPPPEPIVAPYAQGTFYSDLPPAKLLGVTAQSYRNHIKIFLNVDVSCGATAVLRTSPAALDIILDGCLPAQNCPSTIEVNDPLVIMCQVVRENLYQTRCRILLSHAIPYDTIQLRALPHPERIVIDLDKDFEQIATVPLTANLTWERHEMTLHGRYVLLNLLKVRPGGSGLTMGLGLAGGDARRREPVSALTTRKGAVAGINGGYFGFNGGAAGLVWVNGQLVNPPAGYRPPRSAVGFTGDGHPLLEVVDVDQNNQLAPLEGGDWSKAILALGGGPRLLRHGVVEITADQEGLGPSGNDVTKRAGRTVVAVLKDGTTVLVTASGYRNNHGDGLLLDETAELLRRMGAVDAVNLDGGGSTTMVIQGAVVSNGAASDAPERPVADALVVEDGSPSIAPATISLVSGAPQTLPADGVAQLPIAVKVGAAGGRPVPDGTSVRFYASRGVISPIVPVRNGVATAVYIAAPEPGPVMVVARAGTVETSTGFELAPGMPTRVVVRAGIEKFIGPQAAAPTARRARLAVLVTDASNTPLSGRTVRITVTAKNEPPHVLTAITDSNGIVVQDASISVRRVTITASSGSVKSTRLIIPLVK